MMNRLTYKLNGIISYEWFHSYDKAEEKANELMSSGADSFVIDEIMDDESIDKHRHEEV